MPSRQERKRLGEVKNENLTVRITLTGHPDDVDALISEIWRAYLDGEITEREAKLLDTKARKRRTVLKARPARPNQRLAATDNDIAELFDLEIDAA